MLGAYTYRDDSSDSNRNRQLMPADVIRSMKENECLLFVGGKRGVLIKNLKPFYKIKSYLKLSEIPMPVMAKAPLPMPEYVSDNADTDDEF